VTVEDAVSISIKCTHDLLTVSPEGVVFGFSDASTFPSIAVTGRKVTDPLNTVENPITIKGGSEPNTTTRYGDYFGASVDPSESNRIWVAGQYHESPTWSTWISDIVIDNGEVVPDSITDLSLTVISDNQVDLSWSTPADGGSPITGYLIQRKIVGFPGETLDPSFGDATTTSFSDTTLSTGDEVQYRIAAINSVGQGPFSNIPAPVTTTGGSAPDAVTDLSLTVVSGTQVDLSWSTPSSSPPLLGHKIFRNLNGAGFALLVLLPDPLATSFSDTTLSPADQVKYALISVNSVGGSGPSNIPPFVTTPP